MIGRSRSKSPKARADFDSNAVAEAKLIVESDPQPDLPGHVNLCAWPAQKDEQKFIAQFLCNRANLLLNPVQSTGVKDSDL